MVYGGLSGDGRKREFFLIFLATHVFLHSRMVCELTIRRVLEGGVVARSRWVEKWLVL